MSLDKPITIVVGVCGGIAAYKSCEILRELAQKNCAVHVMMTKSACQFITPLTLQTLSKNPVATDLFSLTEESQIGHIRLADKADLVLIAPATANILAKAAHGICDDIISTVLLATKSAVVFAPSMNVNMYNNPVTQENIHKLKNRGCYFIDPEPGPLACGWEGTGRLANPQKIVEMLLTLNSAKQNTKDFSTHPYNETT